MQIICRTGNWRAARSATQLPKEKPARADSSAAGALALPEARRSTSATLSGVACGSQARMVSCAVPRRCSRRGEGSLTAVAPLVST